MWLLGTKTFPDNYVSVLYDPKSKFIIHFLLLLIPTHRFWQYISEITGTKNVNKKSTCETGHKSSNKI